jgi:nucleoside-diphosphate-sugar epimerase
MRTTILLTGANGFVGQHLGKYLVNQGYQVIATTRRNEYDFNFTPQRIVSIGDIGATADWSTALEEVDVVIHLAARVHVMHEPAADPLAVFREVNTAGALRLAQQAAEVGVRRFVFLSSIKVNGESTTSRPFREDDPAIPEDPYGQSKWEAEQQLLALAAKTRMEVTIVRPPLVYGPEVRGNFLRLLELVAKAWPVPLASIKNRRSLVGVQNLCSLLEVCLHHPMAAGEVFLVSDDRDISTPQLLRMLATAMGRPCRLVPFPTTILAPVSKLLGQQTAWDRVAGSLQLDISKARHKLGWQPLMSLEEGLVETVAWYQENYLAKK